MSALLYRICSARNLGFASFNLAFIDAIPSLALYNID